MLWLFVIVQVLKKQDHFSFYVIKNFVCTLNFEYILDADKAQTRLEAMEASRRRMQEQLDAQAARHAEQMKQVRISQEMFTCI